MPPKPKGDAALTGAERTRLWRARLALDAEAAALEAEGAGKPKPPVDRRSRVARWNDAVRTLTDLLDDYDRCRDSLPAALSQRTRAALAVAKARVVSTLAIPALPRRRRRWRQPPGRRAAAKWQREQRTYWP